MRWETNYFLSGLSAHTLQFLEQARGFDSALHKLQLLAAYSGTWMPLMTCSC